QRCKRHCERFHLDRLPRWLKTRQSHLHRVTVWPAALSAITSTRSRKKLEASRRLRDAERKIFPKPQRGAGLIDGVEMQSGSAVAEQRLRQPRNHAQPEFVQSGLVVLKL